MLDGISTRPRQIIVEVKMVRRAALQQKKQSRAQGAA